MTPRQSRNESSDRYVSEVVRVAEARVIICRDGLQWILQHRSAGDGRHLWVNQGYLTRRKPLEALWHSTVGAVPDQIRNLPARFPRETRSNRHD